MSSNLRKIYSLEKNGNALDDCHTLNYLSITFFMVEKLAGFLFLHGFRPSMKNIRYSVK